MSSCPLYARRAARAHRQREIDKRRQLRLFKRKDWGVTPIPFHLKNSQSAPFNHIEIMEWLSNVRPTLYSPHMAPSISSSILTFYENRKLDLTKELKKSLDLWSKSMEADKKPVLLNIETVPKKLDEIKWAPRTFTVNIEETETFQLFYQERKSALENSRRGFWYKKLNEYYSEVKNIKKSDGDTQTVAHLGVSKACGTYIVTKADKSTNISLAKIYDHLRICKKIAYFTAMEEHKSHRKGSAAETKKDKHSVPDKMRSLKKHQTEPHKHRHDSHDIDSEDDQDELWEARKMARIVQSNEFYKSTLLMYKTLERNVNMNLKMELKVDAQPDPFAKEIDMSFKVVFLYMVEFEKVWGLPVTSISINPSNNNLFAVGHGQYYYDQPNYLGRVNLWSIKNLSIPEKTLEFKSGVTSIEFSVKSPYALLVSFIRGYIAVIDISKQTPTYIINEENDPVTFSPILQARWFSNEVGEEIIVTCGGEGLINTYSTKNFDKKALACLTPSEGVLEGIEVPCQKLEETKLMRRPIIHSVAMTDGVRYLAGTSDGCIFECSIEFKDKLRAIRGHQGPVHLIKYHPHSNKIFLTVGIDFCVRVWAEGVSRPIITLSSSRDFIEDADWSPEHPNVIATVSGCVLCIWDLCYGSDSPRVSYRSPSNSKFTVVKFFNSHTVFCGNLIGHVYILGLRDMSFIPHGKQQALGLCIKRFVTESIVLDQLKKSGLLIENDDTDDYLLFSKLKS